MSETNLEVVDGAKAEEDESTIVELTRAYNFEGEKITQIDFAGLEDLTAENMIKANKVLNNSGTVSVLPEMDLYYALVIAADCTGLPIEFFKQLKPRDAIKVKNKVTAFFFGEE